MTATMLDILQNILHLLIVLVLGLAPHNQTFQRGQIIVRALVLVIRATHF